MLFAGALLVPGCAARKSQGAPEPESASATREPEVRYVTDPALEQRVSRLELRLLERDAQVADLQARLDEARREVVRAMAKLQTLATRAEAASAMAEAEIALQSLKANTGSEAADLVQVQRLLRLSAQEFDKQNYGGALYLANQAKSVLATGREGLPRAGRTRHCARGKRSSRCLCASRR